MTSELNAINQRLKSDRGMLLLLLAHIPVVGLLVPMGYGTTVFAVVASVLTGGLALAGYALLRGTRAYSALVAICLMLYSIIMIQAQLGRIEMHFHIFAALAFLLVYRDWMPVVVGAATIAVHHLVFTALQLGEASLGGMPLMVFNYGCSWGIAFLHAAFVVFEASVLVLFAIQQRREQDVADALIDAIARFEQDKDLSVRVESAKENPTVRSFNRMMGGFAELMAHLKQAITGISSHAEHLSALSEQTSRVVQAHHGQAEEASAATQQMASTIHEVAEHAVEAANSADQANAEADAGQRSVRESVEATRVQNDVLNSTAESVDRLSGVVQEIGDMTASIEGISEQTNLLALNAAIEAARAGEAGRGFSVVADEVRKLAQRTQESAEQIQQLIATLRRGTDEAVQSMQQGRARGLETAELIAQSGETIERISQAIRNVHGMNDQIAAAAEQQSAASTQINGAINAISAQGASIAEKAADVSETSVELSQTLTDLKQVVAGYRTV